MGFVCISFNDLYMIIEADGEKGSSREQGVELHFEQKSDSIITIRFIGEDVEKTKNHFIMKSLDTLSLSADEGEVFGELIRVKQASPKK